MATHKPTAAHDQTEQSRWVEHYPEHEPREHDPHYHLFHAYKKAHPNPTCWVADLYGTTEHCAPGPIELHHAVIEESVQNEVDWQIAARRFPDAGIADQESFLVWVQSQGNFRFLCAHHHRSPQAGAHHVSHSAWEAGTVAPDFLAQYDDSHGTAA